MDLSEYTLPELVAAYAGLDIIDAHTLAACASLKVEIKKRLFDMGLVPLGVGDTVWYGGTGWVIVEIDHNAGWCYIERGEGWDKMRSNVRISEINSPG